MSLSDLLVPNNYDIYARSISSSDTSDLKKIVRTIGASQLLALPTTPIELIPAVAGTMTVIMGGVVQVIDNGNPTDKVSGAGTWTPAINFGSTSSLPILFVVTTLTGDQIQYPTTISAGSTAKADVEFKSISLYNAASDVVVAGDTGLEITLFYTQVQLLL